MSSIYHSISEKLSARNIDIYHYEDIVRCYVLAKLNIEHSGNPDYADGIHSAEFAAEISRYQLLSADMNPYYNNHACGYNSFIHTRYLRISILQQHFCYCENEYRDED